jgi:hypothetical protein
VAGGWISYPLVEASRGDELRRSAGLSDPRSFPDKGEVYRGATADTEHATGSLRVSRREDTVKIRAIWHPLPLLGLLALLAVGCGRQAPTDVATDAAQAIPGELAVQSPSPLRTTDVRQEILQQYKEELWPCPPGYDPLQIHEYIATTPTPKLPGDPEYWAECPALPGYATNHNSSVGTASHLGRFTDEWDSCLDFNTFTGYFDAQLTAANGDKLNWTITATGTPLPEGGRYSVTTDVTFDGGTGRFVNATGYAAGAGKSVPGEGENLYYVGCLAY